MRVFLIALSSIITVGSIIPYLLDTVQRKTKPRIVSWFVWSLLTGIACVASFVEGEFPAGILLLSATVATGLVVVLGFKYGDHKFEKIDTYSLVGACGGVVLWIAYNSPMIAIIASIAIDLVGAIPTFKHAWQRPQEETWITFALGGVGGGITVYLAESWTVGAVAYPLYLLVINSAMALLIIGGLYWKISSTSPRS